jgi:hypothetical protein
MSGSEAAAQQAAQAAFHKFTIESWTLYSIGVSMTLLRTYARVRAVGFRNLRPADYLVWVGIVWFHAIALHFFPPILIARRFSTAPRRLSRTVLAMLLTVSQTTA